MSFWRQLNRGIRALVHRPESDRELMDEVQHYLEQSTADHKAQGLTTDQAARAARIDLGGPTAVHEQVRSSGWEHRVETVAADLRYAARRLAHEPGFTLIIILTLGVGIGATTAIYSAVRPILFDSLPYPAADRLVQIEEVSKGGGRAGGTFGMLRGLTERSHSLSAIAAYKAWQPVLTGSGQPERLEGQRVSADFLTVLGVSPATGRGFEARDDQPNGGCSVILTDGLWRHRFGGESSALGRSINLDGAPCAVIGIMPAEFVNATAPDAQLWATLQYDMTEGRAWGHHLATIGRLRPGVDYSEASREIDQAGVAVVEEARPVTYAEGLHLRVVPLKEATTQAVRPALLAILGAVALVLIIACVNVTNLLLARGARRRGEFALRAALGAGQQRLMGQLLTESLLLALMGGVAGMILAQAGVRGLATFGAPQLPPLGAITLRTGAFVFALGLTALVGILFGMAPAVQAARSDPHAALQAGARRSSGSHRATRNALVITEVALALVLLVASGLLLRSLRRLFAVDPGFSATGILTVQIQGVGNRFTDPAASTLYFEQVRQVVARVPGVTAAALTSQLPLSSDLDEYGVHFELSPTETAEGGSTFRYSVSPGYLEAMGIAIRKGRSFDGHDDAGASRVALLSESYAARVFKGLDPIGQRLRIGPSDSPPFTIVGVVADVRQQSLALARTDAVYVPASQWLFADNVMSLVIGTRGATGAELAAIRQAIWSVDPDQPIVRVATMSELLERSAAERRFALVLFESFGLTALLLAGAGIYGVLSGSVVERTREIGVRAALGASRSGIVGLVLRQGLGLTGVGIAIGLAGAVVASPVIAALLFGVSRLDAVTYGSVALLLIGVATLACLVPAWRAARVDPVKALRAE